MRRLENEPDESGVEIEIDDPDAVVEVEIDASDEDSFTANLAEHLEKGVLTTLGSDLMEDIENDKRSRSEWEKTYKEGIKLMGLGYEERTEPWDGACGIFHPMITEAVVRFQAETIMETFPAGGPVKTHILGDITPEKEDAASRVEEDMNYILTEKMPEFRPEHERMLWNLATAGSAFKKVYEDAGLNRQTSVFVPAEDVYLPYGTSEITTCARVTHVMRKTKHELERLIYNKFYIDFDIGDPVQMRVDDVQRAKDKETGLNPINDERHTLFECLVDIDLPGFEDKDKNGEPTDLVLPYVVTMLADGKVIAVRRNWREDDKDKIRRQHFVHYQYIPGFGAYGFGLIHLVGGFAKSATSLTRQLVDAGTLANLPGGLKTKGLRVKGDDTPIAPGEFRDVDVGSGTIRDNIMPLPYKEPSGTLFQLLGTIIEEGRSFASSSDALIPDLNNQGPVGSTLAILERQLKVMSAVQARVHYAFKQELQLLAEIIKNNAPEDYEFTPPKGKTAKREDYGDTDIYPVSDPNASTMAQRVVQYQAAIQMSTTAPQIYDLPHLHRQMLGILGIKNVDKIIPDNDDSRPTDPVTENLNALECKPLKAFIAQDHQSHIQVHQMAMQDPMVQQLIGQNPQAPAIQAALQAHITQHVGFEYRAQMQLAMGFNLPLPDDEIPPEMEVQLSKMLAQAAPQVLAQSQQMAAQKQAQQNQQDPVIQAQLQDQKIAQGELDRKKQKDMQDFQIAQKRLQIEEARATADGQAKVAQVQVDKDKMEKDLQFKGTQMGIDMAHKKAQLNSTEKQTGLQTGVDISKHKAEMQDRQAARQDAHKKQKHEHAHGAALQIMQHGQDNEQQNQEHTHKEGLQILHHGQNADQQSAERAHGIAQQSADHAHEAGQQSADHAQQLEMQLNEPEPAPAKKGAGE
jgi:hypothetical protein